MHLVEEAQGLLPAEQATCYEAALLYMWRHVAELPAECCSVLMGSDLLPGVNAAGSKLACSYG